MQIIFNHYTDYFILATQEETDNTFRYQMLKKKTKSRLQ